MINPFAPQCEEVTIADAHTYQVCTATRAQMRWVREQVAQGADSTDALVAAVTRRVDDQSPVFDTTEAVASAPWTLIQPLQDAALRVNATPSNLVTTEGIEDAEKN